MPSYTYLRKKREALSKRNSEKGKYGNEVKRQRKMQQCQDLVCIGGFQTFGAFGGHCIKLYGGSDPTHFYIKVDGEWKRPRTYDGVRRIVSKWFTKCTIFNGGTSAAQSSDCVVCYQI